MNIDKKAKYEHMELSSRKFW